MPDLPRLPANAPPSARLARRAAFGALRVSAAFGVSALAMTASESPERWVAPVWEDYIRAGPTGQNLPDFSMAGYRYSASPVPRPAVAVSVADFGARPNDGVDDRSAIQAAISAVEKKGGGVVYFPPGCYDLNTAELAAAPTADSLEYGVIVTKSGVVLRGAGATPAGTVFRQHHALLGRNRSGSDYALVRFLGSGAAGREEARLVADARRGDRMLTVDSSAHLKPGQLVKLVLNEPRVDPRDPRADQADLTRALVEPFVLRDDLKDYLVRGTKDACFMLVEVESILSPTQVRLKQPLRIDLPTRWTPRLKSFTAISDVGLEGIRFECDWPGGFAHHKPFPTDAKGDYVSGGPGVIRTANEQNYAWSAVSFTNVAHGWVRDVVTWNYTQDLTISSSKCLTVERVRITGQKGHTGLTLSRTFDCLVQDVTITAPRVHTFFVSGYSSGNVFARSRFDYGPFDQESGCDTCLDFHGVAPYENLYDNIVNAYVYPGGAYTYLPHAGVRNVFWNIIAPPQMLRGGSSGEFFRTYAPTSSGKPLSAHEHWPRAFVIGVHRDGPQITIGGSDADRADEWLTVQGLNRPGVAPASLYEAQVERATSPRQKISYRAGAPAPTTAEAFRAVERICFIGDSITRGGGFHANVFLFYATRFPERRLEAWNCGISGDTAWGAVQRLPWDILPHKPTAAIIMMGANDVGSRLYTEATADARTLAERTALLEKHDQAMRQLVDALQQAGARVSIIAPSISDGTALMDKPGNPAVNEAMGTFAEHDRRLAAARGLGLIEFRNLMVDLTQQYQKNNPRFTLISADRIHPGPVGHMVMAHAFLKAQGMPQYVSKLVVDAAQGAAVAQVNCAASQIRTNAEAVSFDCLANALPFPVGDAARAALQLVPLIQEFNQEVLVVGGLKAGNYELYIDEQVVGSWSADQLAAGINLAENSQTPQYKQAQQVAEQNAKRHDAGANRTIAYLRQFVLGPKGINFGDKPATRAFLEKFAKEEDGDFGHAMAKVYLQRNLDDEALRRTQVEATEAMYRLNQPRVHHYRLARESKPDLEARKAAFDRRNDPENVRRLARDFLSLVILKPPEMEQAGLLGRTGLQAVAELHRQGREREALESFQKYYMEKLAQPERFGVPAANLSLEGKDDLPAADALLQGRQWVNNQSVELGEPGKVWFARPAQTGPYGEADPWSPTLFQPLIKAFVATRDRKYLDRWIAYLDDWAMHNRWSEQIEPNAVSDKGQRLEATMSVLRSLRAIAAASPAAADGIDAPSLARILGRAVTAYPPLYWAYHWSNVENWTSHGFAELMMVGLALDEFRAGRAYFREAQRRMEMYASVQNLPDGTETEHAHWYNINYLKGTSDVLRLAELAPDRAGGPAPAWNQSIYCPVWQRRFRDSMQQRAEYLFRALTPQGQLPIGVRNDKRQLAGQWYTQPLFAVTAAADEPTNARVLSKLFGDGSKGPIPFTSEGFPYGGYYNLRSSWERDGQWADLFCSPVPTGGHGLIGMKNNNAVGLSAFGQDLLLTGGFGSYSYQRSPIRVDGQEQFFHAGIANAPSPMGHKGFMLSWPDPEPGAYRWHSSERFDLAEGIYRGPYGFAVDDHHDQKNFPLDVQAQAAAVTINDVTHQRVLQMIKRHGLWIMTDRVTSPQPHRYTQDLRLPLEPAAKPAFLAFSREQVEIDAGRRTIRTRKPESINLSLYHFGPAGAGAGEQPELTYDQAVEDGAHLKDDYTYRYKLYNHYRVGATWAGKGSQQLVTVLYPRRTTGQEVKELLPLRRRDGRTIGLRATLADGAVVSYVADPAAGGELELDNIRLEGESLLLVREAEGAMSGVALGCKRIALEGTPVPVTGADFEFELRGGELRVVAWIHRPIGLVRIGPARNVFVDQETITLTAATPDLVLHYTTDGSDPSPQSALYGGPFVIRDSLQIKARAFRPGVTVSPVTHSGTLASEVACAWFQKVRLQPAAAVATAAPGLDYERYEGDWRDLVFFRERLNPVATGRVTRLLDLPNVDRRRPFAMVYRGRLTVPADGVYTFHAPREWVLPSIHAGYDLQVFVDEENQWYPATTHHAMGAWSIALAKGSHTFRVTYADFRADAADRLNHPGLRDNYMAEGPVPALQVSGPGIDRQPIPPQWLGRH